MESGTFGAGSKSKSDCEIRYTPDREPFRVEIASSVRTLFGAALKGAIEAVANEFSVTAGILRIDDDGALDYVVRARAEAAFLEAGFSPAGNTARKAPERNASSTDRSRRTRLYLPGNQPHFFINADLFGADVLLFDLEDSVIQEKKFEARILVRNALETKDMFGDRELAVRINSLAGSCGLDDLESIVPARPHAILVPKCETAGDLAAVDKEISRLESRFGLPQGGIYLMALIESARGVLAAREIALASPRTVALCFGREDFTRDIGAVQDQNGALPPGLESLLARQMIVLAAKAAGIQALDSVYSNIEDEAGLARSCAEARAFGFSGKGLVHPVQIEIARRAFRPTDAEADRARKILAAFEVARAEGKGAVSAEGTMIDAPVAERARGILRDYEETR